MTFQVSGITVMARGKKKNLMLQRTSGFELVLT